MKNSDGSLFYPNTRAKDYPVWKATHFQVNKTLRYSDAAYFSVLLHHLCDFSVPAGHCPGCNKCKNTTLEFEFELGSDEQTIISSIFNNLKYEKYEITLSPGQIYWNEYCDKFRIAIEAFATQMDGTVDVPNPATPDPMPDMFDFISEPKTPWSSHFTSYNNKLSQKSTITLPSFPDPASIVKNSVALALLVVPVYLNYFLYPEYQYSGIGERVDIRLKEGK
jgi:hypothetical protein